MKLELNARELYLTLLALNEKYGQLAQLPAPVGDQERAEYGELSRVFNEALDKSQEKLKGGEK